MWFILFLDKEGPEVRGKSRTGKKMWVNRLLWGEQAPLLGLQGERRECCIPKSVKAGGGEWVRSLSCDFFRRLCAVTPTFCPVS